MLQNRNRIPFYLTLVLILACTDLYLVSGIKWVYVFAVPMVFVLWGRGLRLDRRDYFLVAWFASYFLSIGHIISLSDFVIVTAGQLVLFVIYFYFESINSSDRIHKCFYWLQIALYAMVALGAVQLLLYYLFGSTWGISHVTHGVGLPRMSALCTEPDWYGVLCMLSFFFMGANKIEKRIVIHRVIDWIILGLTVIMLLLCLTRASWVGAAAGVLILFVLRLGDRGKQLRGKLLRYALYCIPAVLLAFAALYFSGSEMFQKLITRLDFTKWLSNDGGAADSRSYAISVMLHYIELHPFTGNGAGSMGMISANKELLASLGYPYEINTGRGNANILITNLFDVGIIGTSFLVIYFILLIKDLVRTYKTTGSIYALICLMCMVGLLVDFQFNNGLRQAYVWILMGLGAAVIRINKQGEIL